MHRLIGYDKWTLSMVLSLCFSFRVATAESEYVCVHGRDLVLAAGSSLQMVT